MVPHLIIILLLYILFQLAHETHDQNGHSLHPAIVLRMDGIIEKKYISPLFAGDSLENPFKDSGTYSSSSSSSTARRGEWHSKTHWNVTGLLPTLNDLQRDSEVHFIMLCR